LNLFLQLDRGLLLGLGPLGLCEAACHLRQVQFGAGHSGRRDQHESRYPVFPVGRQQAYRSALAVTDDGHSPAIDILSIAGESDDGAQVLGEVCERGRLGAAATLADAPLVVAQHEVSRVGQGTGELAEDRNAGDGLIAIGQARSADEHEGRQRFASGTGRLRDRSSEREPIRGNPDMFVSVSHHGDAARRDRRNVLPHRVQALRREAHAEQPARFVAPDFGVQWRHPLRPFERNPGAPGVDQPSERLDVLLRRLADGHHNRPL